MRKKILSAMLIIAIIMSFAACGSQGNSFSSSDVADSSATQQRWLKNPDSTIVINPNAIGNTEYKDADGILGLELGITNANGKIVKVLEDAFFILEPTWANGKGGEEVWASDWTEETVDFYLRTHPEATSEIILTTVDQLEEYDEEGTLQRYVKRENGSMELQLWVNQHYELMAKYPVPVDGGDTDYFVLVDCEISDKDRWNAKKTKSYPKIWQIRGYFDDEPTLNKKIYRGDDYTYATILEYVTKTPGFYYENINEAAAEYTGANKTNFVYPTIFLEREGIYKFNHYSIRAINKEVKAGSGVSKYEWNTYNIKSYQEYDNGTVLETVDLISGPMAVTREIKGVLGGGAYYAGSLNGGTPTYTTNTGAINTTLTIKGEGFEYTVAIGALGTIQYYNSYEDLMNMDNGTAEATAESKYWLYVTDSRVTADGTAYIGFAASVNGEDTIAAAQEAGKSKTFRKRMADLEAIWDEFIASNDVRDYIANIPEEK